MAKFKVEYQNGRIGIVIAFMNNWLTEVNSTQTLEVNGLAPNISLINVTKYTLIN